MTPEQERRVQQIRENYPDVQMIPYYRDGIIVAVQDGNRVYVMPNGSLTEYLDD